MHSNPFEDQNPFVHPNDSLDKPEEVISMPPCLKVTDGRPNLEHIVSEEINTASGKVSVSVCGPNAMAKVVREALRLPWSNPSSPLNGGPSVTLHVECFGYA
ncbi:hypothetical protein JVT61DRAFT_13530 [Boletus reticuloceps]|nr:hypothetical protein JVT61DRAFT_13530 [Boletus reticuloceps]